MDPRRTASPALLVCAVFSRYPEAFSWAEGQATSHWGPLLEKSAAFAFDETSYYEAAMGTHLQKQLWAFEQLISQDELPKFKHEANQWEDLYAKHTEHEVPRPLNLDPGYVTLGKLVLASTKNHSHRVYLAEGIFAEVTLHFRFGKWEPWPWTYQDYRRPEVHEFLSRCRDWLYDRLREKGAV